MVPRYLFALCCDDAVSFELWVVYVTANILKDAVVSDTRQLCKSPCYWGLEETARCFRASVRLK
jgi:hypothetical protein